MGYLVFIFQISSDNYFFTSTFSSSDELRRRHPGLQDAFPSSWLYLFIIPLFVFSLSLFELSWVFTWDFNQQDRYTISYPADNFWILFSFLSIGLKYIPLRRAFWWHQLFSLWTHPTLPSLPVTVYLHDSGMQSLTIAASRFLSALLCV